MKKRKMLLWVIKRSIWDHSSPICPHNFSFHTLSLYFLCDSHIIRHIYAPILLIFHPFLKAIRQASSQVNIRSEVEMANYCSHDQNRARRIRAVTSNILAWGRRRNGTETWRRRSCQCEHLRLITHEKSLLNGDVPRRNGTETWRRRSCQCEHLHLITHEKSLLNGDVPRRNGNMTYGVNRP